MTENNHVGEENSDTVSISKRKREAKTKALEEAKDRKNLLRFLGFFVVMIIIVYTFADKGEPQYNINSSYVNTPNYPSSEDAMYIAQSAVKRALTTNSAEFVSVPSFSREADEPTNIYHFKGLVDYVNLYNAPLRSSYHIKIKYKGGDFELPSSYEVLSLDLR